MSAPIPARSPARLATHFALAALACGLFATVLASLDAPLLALDMFAYPKELAVHTTALLVSTALVLSARRLELDAVQLLLLGFLALGAASSFAAVASPWVAVRSYSLYVSVVALLFSARALAGRGLRPALLTGIAAGALAVAILVLLDAYGFLGFDPHRGPRPSATLGNRNYAGHFLALSAPSVLLLATVARRPFDRALGIATLCALAAAVALVRTRAAWLGLAAAALGTAGLVVALRLPPSRAARRRLLAAGAAVALGVGAAIALPNELRWVADSPYRDTLERIGEWDEGSGRGRLAQYRGTLSTIAGAPLLGVGPGSWWRDYYRSLLGQPLTSIGHLPGVVPTTEWIGVAAQWGVPALGLLAAAVGVLAAGAWRILREPASTPEMRGVGLAGLATLAIAGTVGIFDALVARPSSAFIVPVVLGALAPPPRPLFGRELRGAGRALAGGLVCAALLLCTLHSGLELAAALARTRTPGVAGLVRAAEIVPHNDRIQAELATQSFLRNDCEQAAAAASRALELNPNHEWLGSIQRICETQLQLWE